jgi:glyoxylase-like metal-dependent hydrolase (beta-lactamase superfamily II)
MKSENRYRKTVYSLTAVLAAFLVHSIAAAQGDLPDLKRRVIDHVAGDVYTFTNDLHVSIFMVTDDGVIASDPITPEGAAWLNDEIKQRFDKQVKYVIYSHDHYDHISGGSAFEGAAIVAHENTREPISASEHPIAAPNITFKDELVIELGGKRVELFYFGPGHSNSMIYMRFPEQGILFVVDTLEMDSVPFRTFPGDDIDGLLDSLTAMQALDFDILVAGHSVAEDHSPVGTRDNLVEYQRYITSLKQRVSAELAAGKSADEIKGSIDMSEYSHLRMYDVWGPMNIDGMVQYLMAQ